MKKIMYFIVFLFLVVQHRIAAQSLVSWGIFGGFNLSTISNLDKPYKNLRPLTSFKSIKKYPFMGENIGFYKNKKIAPSWSVYTTAGFQRTGQGVIELVYSNDFEGAIWQKKELWENYFYLNPNLQYAVSSKCSMSVGGLAQYLSDVVNTSYYTNNYRVKPFIPQNVTSLPWSPSSSDLFTSGEKSSGIYDIFKNFDYGIRLGFSYRLSERFGLNFSTYQGIQALDIPNKFPSDYVRRNQSYGVVLAIDCSKHSKKVLDLK